MRTSLLSSAIAELKNFSIHKYGRDSTAYSNYIDEDKDYLKFVNHMLRGAKTLDSLYQIDERE